LSETITACESICRDFHWFWDLDPSIVQGLLTVGAASIGAAVALYIAKSVYPLQKEKDRDIKIDEEKRLVYRDYLKNIELIVNSRHYGEVADRVDAILKCKSALNEVLIFSNKQTAKKMWDLYFKASAFMNALPAGAAAEPVDKEKITELVKLANKSFTAAVNSVRQELGGDQLDFNLQIAHLSTQTETQTETETEDDQ